MRASTRIGQVLLVWAGASACDGGRTPGSPHAEPPPPEVPAESLAEEPARPEPDAQEVAREFDDETEGLDLDSWEGSGPTQEDQAASGTIGGSFTLPRPFPPRAADHRDLLRGRGRSTQTAVREALTELRARALPGGGWAEEGVDPDEGLTSLGVLACFSLGDVWTDRREPPAGRAACKWLSRQWTARARREAPVDRASNSPADLRSSALLVLALSEWRAWSWVVYAEDEGALSLRALEAWTERRFPDGASVTAEDAATDAAWTLLALHVARLAEFDVDPQAAARILAALERDPGPSADARTVAAVAVARALGTAFHRPRSGRADVAAALGPALAPSSPEAEMFTRPSDLTFLASVAVMQVGGEVARDWNRRVLRPLVAAPRSSEIRELALTAMCLSSYFRYSPVAKE